MKEPLQSIYKRAKWLKCLHVGAFMLVLIGLCATAINHFGRYQTSLMQLKNGSWENVAQIPGRVERRLSTPEGTIWLCQSDPPGLYQLRFEGATRVEHLDLGERQLECFSVILSSNGVWVLDTLDELEFFDGKAWHKHSLPSNGWVPNEIVANGHELWGLRGDELFYFDGTRWTVTSLTGQIPDGLKATWGKRLLVSKGGHLWIVADDAWLKTDRGFFKFELGKYQRSLVDVIGEHDDRLWVERRGEVYILSARDQSVSHFHFDEEFRPRSAIETFWAVLALDLSKTAPIHLSLTGDRLLVNRGGFFDTGRLLLCSDTGVCTGLNPSMPEEGFVSRLYLGSPSGEVMLLGTTHIADPNEPCG